MISEHGVNVFIPYKEENSFTNGLLCLLKLSSHERPRLVKSFLKLVSIESDGELDCRFNVRVLRGIDAADAELRIGSCCLRFETKVESGCLTHDQVSRRLRELMNCPGRLKRVVLLTPDDGRSRYVQEIVKKYTPHVAHLEWRNVYTFLEKESSGVGTFSELVNQFLQRIKEKVFEQDFAGAITKIAFDYGQVDRDGYLDDFRKNQRGDAWNLPSQIKQLDGTHRKLLFYDNRRGITAEVEVKGMRIDRRNREFPCYYVFADRPTVFEHPIPLQHIRQVPGFENFGLYRKDRSPYRNITREQYAQLVGPQTVEAAKVTSTNSSQPS